MPISFQPSTNPGRDLLLEAHESRLQAMEEYARETSNQLGIHTQHLDDLATKIESGVVTLGKKIEDTIKPVAEAIKHLDTTISNTNKRVATLEEAHQERIRAEKQALVVRKEKKTRLTALVWTSIGALLTFLFKDGLPLLLKHFAS